MSEQVKKYYAVKLLSPRPTFPFDISDEERKIMDQHSQFWNSLFANQKAIVTGPVLDPKGAYGFGIIIANTIEEADLLMRGDPAQRISKYEIYEMLAVFPAK